MNPEQAETPAMDGESFLVIGKGGTGKTGFVLRQIRKTHPEKFLILAPSIRHPWLKEIDSPDYGVETKDDLVAAWEDSETEGTLILVPYRESRDKRKPIWRILSDEEFNGFTIFADELAVLNNHGEDEDAFNSFITGVRARDQKFWATLHRIPKNVDGIVLANVEKIYFVGRVSEPKELESLWNISNQTGDMTFQQFSEKLSRQDEVFEWWKKEHPNTATAVFEVYK